jgi:hypothetical protein
LVQPVSEGVNIVGPGTLKCIVFRADAVRRQVICDTLRSRVGSDGLRHVDTETILVFTEASPADIRDWLAAAGGPGAWILVVEFEKWSGYGGAIDREWLLARGH